MVKMMESLYLTNDDLEGLKNMIGDEMANIYILWSNLYTMIHVKEWMNLSDIENEDNLTDSDWALISAFMLDKFFHWCKYNEIIEE